MLCHTGGKKYTTATEYPFLNSDDKAVWKHIAFTHQKYWGYQLESEQSINCGNSDDLHLNDEFSLEVLVTIDQVGTLLKKEGEYRLEMDNNKRIIFCDGKGVNYLFEEEEYYIDSNGEKVVTSPERKPDPLTLNEFVKITLIRSKNKPQTAPSIAEYPISGGNPEPLTLKNNIDKSATELEVNEEPSGYGVNDLIKIDSEILKITKIDKKTLTFDRHEDTDVENHYAGSYIYLHRDQSKWYADKKG